jgi:hypothetical protein
MKTLNGTEKQVKWANDIRDGLVNELNSKLEEIQNDGGWSNEYKQLATEQHDIMMHIISDIYNSRSFIDNRDVALRLFFNIMTDHKREARAKVYDLNRKMKAIVYDYEAGIEHFRAAREHK